MSSGNGISKNGSHVDRRYAAGTYFEDPLRHNSDAKFKAECFLKLLRKSKEKLGAMGVRSYIDVGCGSGEVVRLIADSLRKDGFQLETVKGYDVSPHVRGLHADAIDYVHGDYSESDDYADLVTLFDVLEHVVDPIGFLKRIATRSRIVGLHLPLDYSVSNAMRDKFQSLLEDPGHRLFLDTTLALNLLTLSGLRIVAYDYTFGFRAPSGHGSIMSKIAYPLRWLLSKISPWLMSKTVGGASLMVVALTPAGQSMGEDA